MSGDKPKYRGLPPLPPEFVREFPPIAKIVEKECIGCDRCPPLCFFDALFMEERADHPYGKVAVVVDSHCTGCGLCFEACPVDAIVWVPDHHHPAPHPPHVPPGGKERADDHH